MAEPIVKHWYVLIWPDQYNDSQDTGYAWSGPADNREDAIKAACEECSESNGTGFGADPADIEPGGYWHIDPATVKVCDAMPDTAHHARQLLAAARALDAALNDAERPPTGEDYNALFGLITGWLEEAPHG